LYSSVNNHDTSTSILSIKEILAVIVVFAFVLYLLFPKGDIESFIKDQEGHTNLSINYLESMLLYHPENKKLKMMLVKKYDFVGKTEQALKLNQELIDETNEKSMLVQLYKQHYLLKKLNYFKTGDKELLKKLKKQLLDYYNYTKGERDTLFFYAESTNIDYAYIKYHSLKDLMKEEPSIIDYELEKIRYYLADKLNYKEDAYRQLTHLLNYVEIEQELQAYAIHSLIAHQEYEKAASITQNLMLNSFEDSDITKYFHLSLYVLSQNKERKKSSISTLIGLYVNIKELDSADIYTVLNTLLQNNNLKEASSFAYKLFYQIPEKFNEKNIDLALTVLTYNSQLDSALEISSFAYHKYHQQKYLDKSIQFSLWSGKIKEVTKLNIVGYNSYTDSKYENYLLEHTSFNNGYQILGKIYHNKVNHGNYKFVKKLSDYFIYTGEIDKGEIFFTKLLKKVSQKEVHAATINFSFDNSHFEKGFKLYTQYKTQYGINTQLQNKTIKKLLAAKKFKQAYRLAQELHQNNTLKHKQLFVDLSWYHKDYNYLYRILWNYEKITSLAIPEYEHLILLEKALNGGKKIEYLYQKAWKETKRSDYLLALLYDSFDKKDFQLFKRTIDSIDPIQKIKFEKDINYRVLLANYYIQTKNLNLALDSFHKALALAPNKVTTHQSYLWFLLDNYAKNSSLKNEILVELALLKKAPSLQESIGIPAVMAAMALKKYELASRWNLLLLQSNPSNSEYQKVHKELQLAAQAKMYEHYDKMLNNDYLKGQISLKKEHLSKASNMTQSNFSYQWKAYKNIESKLSLAHYEYQTEHQKKQTDTSLEFALRNTQERFLWDFKFAPHDAETNYFSASLNLGYQLSSLNINLESKYQNKTTLTPQLEQNGLENSLAISLNNALSRRVSLGFLFKNSQFKNQQGIALGTAKTMQVSANYILRSGYPDISFNTYLNHNSFTQNIAHNFSEFGIASSIGTARQYTLNRTWKPFASVGFSINNQKNLGSSLSFGLSKMLRSKDSLDFLFHYSNGIGVISEPIYGLELKYRF